MNHIEKQTIYTIKQAAYQIPFQTNITIVVKLFDYIINEIQNLTIQFISFIYNSSYNLKKQRTKSHNKVGNIIIDSFYPSQEPLLVSALEPR